MPNNPRMKKIENATVMLVSSWGYTAGVICTVPITIEKTSIAIASENIWPIALEVETMADAIPRDFRPTELMMAFVFGDEKRP
jgi:threonine/homoserine efflux transporter RhtA